MQWFIFNIIDQIYHIACFIRWPIEYYKIKLHSEEHFIENYTN
jgi:hypothetical protein